MKSGRPVLSPITYPGNAELVKQVEHRPYPLPAGPWVMKQIWEDLLFAHWAIDPEVMRALVPPRLPLDLFENQAYIAVVPFRMRGIRPRGLPAVPWLSNFAELNVRTYVTLNGKPGVYFFSLDAANPVGVWLGRNWFHLPYQNARMACEPIAPAFAPRTIPGDQAKTWIRYYNHRTHRGSPAAEFIADYGPTGPVYHARRGTLEHWLTERYCLYALDQRGQVYRGEIHHAPWPLQPAAAQLAVNTMLTGHALTTPPVPPLLHFARCIDVVVWPPQRIAAG